MNNNKYKIVTMGISHLLFVVFLVLKLTETINWRWFWVLSPLWIPLLIIAIAIVVAYLMIESLKK